MEVIRARGQGQLYIHDDYTYLMARVVGEKRYMRCNMRGCRATGLLVNDEFKAKKPHNHDPDLAAVQKLRLKDELTKNVLKLGTKQNMRKIYDETCQKYGAAATKLPFVSLRSSMYRTKQSLEHIANPADLKEFADILAEKEELGKTKDEPPQPFFQRYIERKTRTVNGEEGWSAVVFESPTLKQLLGSSTTIHIDSSSKAVPKDIAQQLITVHVLYMDHLFPVIFVLLTSDSEESYAGVLNEVVTIICPESRRSVQFITTDYDLKLMNAANGAWPNATITGCFFYYANDVFRKHESLMMSKLTNENVHARTGVEMLMSLPLLPAPMIIDGLHEIHQYLLEHGLQESFSALIEYMEQHWIMTIGPYNMSVYQQMHRTNNGIAGFLFSLLSKMGPSRSMLKFTGALRFVENSYAMEYSKLVNGRPTYSERRRGQKTQDQQVERCWKHLNDKDFRLLNIINSAAHAVESIEERIKELIRVENPNAVAKRSSISKEGNTTVLNRVETSDDSSSVSTLDQERLPTTPAVDSNSPSIKVLSNTVGCATSTSNTDFSASGPSTSFETTRPCGHYEIISNLK